MLLLWRIRYLDTHDKQFKDRDLQLDTNKLEPVTRAAIETIHALENHGGGRKMLRYRHLFTTGQKFSELNMNELCIRHNHIGSLFIHDYSEDENGKELTHQEPETHPVPVDNISLSPDDLKVLGYFTRDLRRMIQSTFYQNRSGYRITGSSSGDVELQTAMTDDEILAFVTIFRQFYMEQEPANFQKAVKIFTRIAAGHPLATWVGGIRAAYKAGLNSAPHCVSFSGKPFTQKQLIDAFLYTGLIHQPKNGKDQEYLKCLAAIGNKPQFLIWLFLNAVSECALYIHEAGVVIADLYDRYCQHHQVSCQILDAISKDTPGLGDLEKEESRKARILSEKTEELTVTLWKNDGCPAGGARHYYQQAHMQLKAAMGCENRTDEKEKPSHGQTK